MSLQLLSFYNHTYVSNFNPCSNAFVVKEGWFNMNSTVIRSKLLDEIEKAPMIINWSVGKVSCSEARKLGNYSCKANSKCVGSELGYTCKCSQGYTGNPYLPHGCQGNNYY